MGERAAEIVREFREEIGFTQAQFATVLKISQGNLSQIENGCSIPKRTAKKLAILIEKPLELFV